MPLQIIRQDITKMNVDAIVNPSNEELFPGGGVDAAIHDAAGKELLVACRAIGGIETSEAVITPAFRLPCKYVIHTAGPLWRGGEYRERELLTACYQNALSLAAEHACESVAFPLISSGLYGYPKDQVLKIALDTISEFLFHHEMMVFLVVYDQTAYEFSEKLFSGIKSYIDDCYEIEQIQYESVLSMPTYMPSRCACADSAERIEDFIQLDEGFAVKLLKLIDAKGMSDVECYKKANVSKQTWYKIMNERHYKPNRKTVISFALALHLSLRETQNLLASVGFTLSNSSLFDVIIMYCIEHNIYDVLEIDSVLFQYDQETLYSKF